VDVFSRSVDTIMNEFEYVNKCDGNESTISRKCRDHIKVIVRRWTSVSHGEGDRDIINLRVLMVKRQIAVSRNSQKNQDSSSI
jgi:hypothetical protein